MSEQGQAVLLFVLGSAVLRAALSDLYLRYLRPGFRPYLIAAGIMLIAVAVTTAWYQLRATRARRRAVSAAVTHPEPGPAAEPGHAPEQDHGHGHGHGHREPRITWLLVLPLIALIAVSPPALGSYAANRSGTGLQAPPGFPALPAAGDPLPTTLDDYATRAVYDHGRSLGTRRFELTGFVAYGPGGTPYLIRMLLTCCAADALPIKIALSGKVPPDLRTDSWLTVVGRYAPQQLKDDVNGGPIPFMDVERATTVPTPTDPYEG